MGIEAPISVIPNGIDLELFDNESHTDAAEKYGIPRNKVTIFFADREPAGPYRITVKALRTKHVRFNEFTDPEPVPHDTDYASVIDSDVPVVIQHTRLDSRQPALSLMSTIAYPV